MPADRYAVGIDLGGSKLRGGLLSEAGQLAGRIEAQTEAWKGPAGVLANLKRALSQLLDSTDRSRVTGIGIAAAGMIHPKTHAVVYAPNLEWRDVPLRDEIESAFGLPTYVENDVRAAAWGEYRFGAGRGVQSLIAVFVGTGGGSGARGARAAEMGDPFARELWQDAERYLGMALANYVTLLNPEILVLGGGVMTTGPALGEALAPQGG